MPSEASKQYDMHEVIARLVDGGEFDEYKDITEKDIEVKIQDQQIETGLGAGRKYCRE